MTIFSANLNIKKIENIIDEQNNSQEKICNHIF